MKITIVLGAFFPVPPTMGGGVEKVWFSLAPEFVKRGHDVMMVSRKIPELPHEETIDGVKHLRVEGFDTPRSLVWLKFLDLIYSLRTMSILPDADIIVTNTFWLPILLRGSKRGNVYVHAGRYPKGQMRFYGSAARLQAPSHPIAGAIATEAPRLAHKIAVIPYPVTRLTATGVPPVISDRDKIILFVGRVNPEKGVHVLVDAFASGARAAFADWKLMIVGPTQTKLGGGGEPYSASLRRAAENAEGKISFAGPIFDATELASVYRNARVFIYPSLAERGESFGLAPLEAMAHGCGVLVSNLDCFQDFIRDNETGFIFDHRAQPIAETLRDKIDNVIHNETLLARVAAAGYEKSAEYSPEHVAEQFLKDFESVIRN
ncbi:MAG TPA: glycosyltransferase family 4 protein [Chthoniobacterales bacterium]|jgi:glycosyltransferase involved in cell wall biosynthesis|nr:glycosyltransferase family 4 protein [Chthoniobacterales bacterium]